MNIVLLVEDNQIYRETMQEALEYEGYYVIPAENGAIALSLLQQNKPDVILSNGNMPLMTGVELLQVGKADDQLKTIPFALITGDKEDGLAKVARDLGVAAVLHKPIMLDELHALLHSLLKQ